jgi:hypothetical protein
MATSTVSTILRPAEPLRTILTAGLIAGFLDGMDAVVFIGLLHGIPVTRVFQFIASGLLGVRAFHGGWTTALLGCLLHFLIAIGAATVFYALSLAMPMLLKKPLLWGPLYGIGVFLVMRYVVVALSATPKQPPAKAAAILNLILSHIFFVGIPIAWVTAKSARERSSG